MTTLRGQQEREAAAEGAARNLALTAQMQAEAVVVVLTGAEALVVAAPVMATMHRAPVDLAGTQESLVVAEAVHQPTLLAERVEMRDLAAPEGATALAGVRWGASTTGRPA